MADELIQLGVRILAGASDDDTPPLPARWRLIGRSHDDSGNAAVTFCVRRSESQGALHVTTRDGRAYIGRELNFGYPVEPASLNDRIGDVAWFIPEPSFSIQDAEALALGLLTFDRFHALVNITARVEMGMPRERFPASCLVMLLGTPSPLKWGNPQQPERYFVLWTQAGGRIKFYDLPKTDSPHAAATYARDLGFSPTIYRSTCGSLLAFRNTDGGVFLRQQ
jgi:hypothetical protein